MRISKNLKGKVPLLKEQVIIFNLSNFSFELDRNVEEKFVYHNIKTSSVSLCNFLVHYQINIKS